MAHEAGQKLPPPPSTPQLKKRLRSIVTDCRQGNKSGHQLGCEFQSSRY